MHTKTPQSAITSVHPAWRALLLATVVALGSGLSPSSEPRPMVLDVPYRSQFDGTAWGSSNCGPASLGMVLSAFGVGAPPMELRRRADELLGFADPEQGTRLQDLARIATEHGLTVTGPYDTARGRPQAFRRWTIGEARAEVLAGHPLVIEIYYPLLSNHRANPVDTDHYLVLVGLDGDGFVFNDPANKPNPGYRVRVGPAELTPAWANSDFPYGGFSVGPGAGTRRLQAYPAEKEARLWQAWPRFGRLPRAV